MVNVGRTRWMSASLTALAAGLALGSLASSGCAKGGGKAGEAAMSEPSGAARGPASSRDSGSVVAQATQGSKESLPEVQSLEKFDAAAALGYRPEWVGYAVMPGGRTVRSMEVLGDLVAVHNSGNLLSVLETATGRVRWSLEVGSPLERFVGTAIGPNGDLLCCQQGEILILDARTGVLKDRQRLEVIANTRPLVFDNMVIFGCPTGEVLGHNLTSGYKQWGHVLKGAIIANPVRVGDNVGAVSSGGEVAILDPRRGRLVGSSRVFGGTDATPAGSGNSLFIASLDQSLWSFDQFGGAARWRVRTEFPLRDRPVYHEGRVYVAIPGQGMACLRGEDGSRVWTASGLLGEVVGVRGDRLIVWDGKVATTLDVERGDVVTRVELPGVAHVTTDAFVDGNLYTSTSRGEVSKFSPRK